MAKVTKAQRAAVLAFVADKVVPTFFEAYRAATAGLRKDTEVGYTRTTACLPNTATDGKYIPSLEAYVAAQLTDDERMAFGDDMAQVLLDALQGHSKFYVTPKEWTFGAGKRAGETVRTVVVGQLSNTSAGFRAVVSRD